MYNVIQQSKVEPQEVNIQVPNHIYMILAREGVLH